MNIIQFNRSALNQDVCQTLDLSRIPHNNIDGSVVTAVHCCAALGLSHLFGEIENHYVITECRQLVRRSIEVSLDGVTAVADGDPVIEAQVIGCANVRTATAICSKEPSPRMVVVKISQPAALESRLSAR